MVQQIQKYQKKIAAIFRTHPRRYTIIGVFLFGGVLVGIFLWPQHVTFSYAGKTCFYQPAIAPDLLRSESSTYKLDAAQKITVGDVTIGSLSVCITPLKAPEKGNSTAYVSLMGIPWLHKMYTISTPDTPIISVHSLGDKQLSTSKPVMILMTAPDTIFSYKLKIGEKTTACVTAANTVTCEIKNLSLRQGADYVLELQRYFAGTKVATVARQPIKTLTATAITEASIANGQLVFAKPKSIELTADKDLASGAISMVRIDGDKRMNVPIQVVYKNNKAIASWSDDLARQATFEVMVDKFTATDGSGLDGAYKVQFKTSGGPKVQSMSVGNYKLPLGATATITFDQPILATQDLAKSISASGGAVITGKRANQVFVSFAGVPRCGDVSITVGDTLQSDYGITGGSAWRYTTRMICQLQNTIGTSMRGRPITSYSFGSGANTIVYTGAIHGDEISTRSLMYRWIDELEARVHSIPADKTVVVIPVLNPDGYAVGARTNARNVDLNRNFATADWKSDITTTSNKPFPGGGGDSPLSEPESRAIASYVGRVRPLLVLSYHSIGGLLASNQAGNASSRAAMYSGMSGYRNTTGSTTTFEYGISGTADDYYAEAFGVPSVLIELGSHTDPQFARNRDAMWAMLR